MRTGVFMEIKHPFSWTSCSCGPSEAEGDRRHPGAGGPAELSAHLWRSGPKSLSSHPWALHRWRPCLGPVAGAESAERLQGCGGPRAAQPGLRAHSGPPGTPAAACAEGEAPGCSQLPPAVLGPQTAARQRLPRSCLSFLPQRLPPGSRVSAATCLWSGTGTLPSQL